MSSTILTLFFLNLLSPNPADHVQKIDQLMSTYHKYHQFNGSVLVAKGNQIIYQKGFGTADTDLQLSHTAHTRFHIASLTKQFTAALVLKLVAEGKLQLNHRIIEHLPYYTGEGGTKVTIRHLLNHTSGIASFGRDKHFMRTTANQPVNTKDFILTRCSSSLAFEPGTQFRYSNSGYYILGAIVEAVTKQRFEQALNHYLFEPLGLEDIGFSVDPAQHEQHAKPYHQYGSMLEKAVQVHPSVSFAAGGICGNATAIFKWQRALIDGKVLPANLLQDMITPGLGNYGFGLRCGTLQLNQQTEAQRYVAHGGSLFGFNHYQIHLIDSGIQIIILSNAGQRPDRAEHNILSILNDLEYQLPKPKLVDAISPTIFAADQQTALKLAKRLLKAGHYNADIPTFMDTGYRLFESGAFEQARAMFLIAIALFPNHGLLFEGLGKVYLAEQDIAKAIAAFQNAYQLDPVRCDDAKRFLDHVGANQPTDGNKATLSETTLKQYIGTYRLTPRRTLRIYLEEGKLKAQPSGQKPVKLVAQSSNYFQVEGHSGTIEFQNNADQKSTSLILTLNGRKRKGVRIH